MREIGGGGTFWSGSSVFLFHPFPEVLCERGGTPLLVLSEPAGGLGVLVFERQVGVVVGLELADHGDFDRPSVRQRGAPRND